MERLTNRSDDGQAFMNCEECEASWCKKSGNHKTACTAIYCRNRLKDRLAAYEDFMDRWHLKSIEDAERIFRRVNDLGGTDLMAQYRELGSINHLRDLIQAEKDGIPKCGTKVFVLTTVGYWPKKYAKPEIIECFVTTHRLAKNGETKFSVDGYWASGSYYKAVFGKTSMGKTVFLTREEAEAVLAGKGGEG